MSRPPLDDRRLHQRSIELAATAVDFDLTTAEATELEAHLAACPTCARRAVTVRADASTLGRQLTLLPSARVDVAVYAEIARREARPQRLLLLAAAVLLVIALLGSAAVGAYLLRNSQTLPTSVVPLPTAQVVLASPRPEASSVVLGETWGTLAIPASDVGSGWIGLMNGVAVTESGFVAVGRPVCVPQNEPTNCHASVWTAAPGEGWTHVPDQPGLEISATFPTSGPEPGMLDVAAGPAGLVAIGWNFDPKAGGPGIWHSPDGRTWQRAQVDFGASPAEANAHRIVAVAGGPRGYVIVGYVIAGFSTRAPAITARAAAWTSPDGVTWTRAVDSADMDVGPCQHTGEEPSCGGMRGVTPIGSGYVAVGQARSNPGDRSRPAAWTSPDGITWTRSDAGLTFDGFLSGVTAGGAGLVAVGTICQPSCFNVSPGVAATSRDGSTWTFSPVAGANELDGVAFAGGHTFALGVRSQDVDPRAELQLWRTDDGLAWQRVTGLPSIPDATSYRNVDVAAADDRLVVVGSAEVTGADGFRDFSFVSPPAGSSAPPDNPPLPTPR